MKALRDRILRDGRCYEGGILKVDRFLNHQMAPNLMKQCALELIRRYASSDFNKILTFEASGIAPAIMRGFLLDLPVFRHSLVTFLNSSCFENKTVSLHLL